MSNYIIYILSSISLLSALMMILSKDPIRSAFCLILVFFTTAGIWLILGAEFLSLILILVYVGAVMTLFMFAVMLLNYKNDFFKKSIWQYFIFLVLIMSIVTVCLYLSIGDELQDEISIVGLKNSTYTGITRNVDDVTAIGVLLYEKYGVLFIIAGIILLVAIISTISLVHRVDIKSKKQIVAKQLMEDSSSVTLVDIPIGSTRRGND